MQVLGLIVAMVSEYCWGPVYVIVDGVKRVVMTEDDGRLEVRGRRGNGYPCLMLLVLCWGGMCGGGGCIYVVAAFMCIYVVAAFMWWLH